MDPDRGPGSLANLLQSPDMVPMAMGDQDIPNGGILRFLQDTIRLGRWIDNHVFPRSRADQKVTVVLGGTHFQPFELHFLLLPKTR